jgi:ketosteroid isomerase-like protein
MHMRDGKIHEAETFVNPGQAKRAWHASRRVDGK